MFYCNPCAKKHQYPVSTHKSTGPCEVCKKVTQCNDVPAKYLPMKFKKSDVGSITPDNVEESIEMAIAMYESKKAYADCIFWANVIDILRQKWERDHKCLEHLDLWKEKKGDKQ